MEDPDCRVFISTDAGSTGLNLQVASLVINLDLPWNPAVLEQRIARIYRIGQKRSIQVINMVARDSFEERMLSTLNFKSSLFEGIFDGGNDTVVLDDSRLGKVLEGVSEYLDAPSETAQSDDLDEPMETPAVASGFPNPEYEGTLTPDPDIETEGICTDDDGTVDVMVGTGSGDEADGEASAKGYVSGGAIAPEALVSQGVAFLSGLAETLRSEEGVKKLTDVIVATDPETGKSELRIPVPDKDTVAGILGLFGKLLKG